MDKLNKKIEFTYNQCDEKVILTQHEVTLKISPLELAIKEEIVE